MYFCDDRLQRIQDASVYQRLPADFPAHLCALGASGDCIFDGGRCRQNTDPCVPAVPLRAGGDHLLLSCAVFRAAGLLDCKI